GHFGDGCVHVRIDFELATDQGRAGYRGFIEDAADLVASYGGSMSGEHGDGRARSELLPKMYSPAAIALMAQAKRILDPDNILNPGVLVDPAPFDVDLRLEAQMKEFKPALRMVHDGGSFAHAVHRCTGVGKCLADNTGTGAVMCPSYTASRDEKDSTRGRAHVLQEVVRGELSVSDPAVADALDLCLSCKGCSRDCPTGVDMAAYKSEILHQKYKGKLRPPSHYALGQLPRVARITPPGFANAMMKSKFVGRLMKAGAGVDQRRHLPLFSTRRFRKNSPKVDQPDVWIWADSFTDCFAADAGRDAVALLEGQGLKVGVIAEPACCGLTWITTGQLDAARRIVGKSVEMLHPYVTSGVPVIALEPSCLAAMREDATQLLDDPRAAEVGKGIKSLAEFLLERNYQPPKLAGRQIVVQPHCHQHAVIGFESDLALLKATGADVVRLGGCCGLAGNFGVEKGHYETSVAIAQHQLLPAIAAAGSDAIVVADGFSCRTQVHDLSDARVITMAQLFAGRADG
ncbi:MAG: 4Fe-4S dicluster domain-containing protein, partial [Nocardioidaceae bacterium]|nr:4Fe-4S dicluster domain-containing protein [Nocardioidaceae bacterium]